MGRWLVPQIKPSDSDFNRPPGQFDMGPLVFGGGTQWSDVYFCSPGGLAI